MGFIIYLPHSIKVSLNLGLFCYPNINLLSTEKVWCVHLKSLTMYRGPRGPHGFSARPPERVKWTYLYWRNCWELLALLAPSWFPSHKCQEGNLGKVTLILLKLFPAWWLCVHLSSKASCEEETSFVWSLSFYPVRKERGSIRQLRIIHTFVRPRQLHPFLCSSEVMWPES
jgi:hypothetical protein